MASCGLNRGDSEQGFLDLVCISESCSREDCDDLFLK